MSQLGTAYVQIVPSAQGISGKIQKAINPEASAAGISAGDKIAGGMKGKLSRISGGLFKAGAIATAVSVPIVAGIKKSLDAYQVQAGAETKLTEIYKSRMGATKQAAAETMKLASALQKEGVVGDEVTLSGAQQLATFAKYPGTVNALLPAMNNLLVQQKGLNGTSQDATNIANLMGKVMQGQTGALKRVGVSFTEAEEKVLKYGTEEERAAMLSKVITNNVGNMNKTMAQTPEGKIQQMKNSLGDMAEKIGSVLAPVLAKLAKWVSTNLIPKVEAFFKFLDEHPAIKKLAVTLTGLAVAIGPVLIALSGLIKMVSGVGSVFKIVAGGPVMWIAAAIAAVAVAAYLIVKNWGKVKAFLLKIWEAIKAAFAKVWNAIVNVFKSAWNAIKSVWSTVAGFFRNIWNAIKSVFSSVGNFFKERFQKAVALIKSAWSAVTGFFRNIWNGIKAVFSGVINFYKRIFTGAWRAIKTAFSKVGSFFSGVWRKIKSAFTAVVSWFGNLFRRAWEAVKSAFSGVGEFFGNLWDIIKEKFSSIGSAIAGAIGDAVKSGLNAIIGFFEDKVNGIIDLINGAIGLINKIPGVDIGKIKHVSFPRLARGGVLEKGQVGLLEGSGAEAVVPLERNKKWIGRVADDLQVSLGAMPNRDAGKVVNISINTKVDGAEKPEEYASRLVRQLKVEMRTI